MCDTLKRLQQDRANASARLTIEMTRANSRQMMLAFQAAAKAVEDHERECAECKRELQAWHVGQQRAAVGGG